VAAPLVTAAGDIVTIPALFVATFVVGIRWVTPTVAVIFILLSVTVTARGLLTDLQITRRVLRESLLLLGLAATVDIIAGLFLEQRLEQFTVFPALLVLVPPFLETAGALGGILASRLSSKLHLGVLTPRGRPENLALLDVSVVFLFAVVSFLLVGIAADVAAGLVGLASPGALEIVGVSMLGGFIATCLAAVVAYYAAVATYRVGMDPDTHGIPLITSSMDFLGVVSVTIGIAALGIV
jgi:mgtE-like transporter